MRRDISQKTQEATAFRPLLQRAMGSRLGFRMAGGTMKSLQYMHLMETEFNVDLGGIILEFAGHRVTILGRNLEQLYFELESEEVGEIWELHTDSAPFDDCCWVREILWEKL